jgi:hypothetical protein
MPAMIFEQLERPAIAVLESSIPPDVTLDEWRRRRSRLGLRRARRRLLRRLAFA